MHLDAERVNTGEVSLGSDRDRQAQDRLPP